MFVQVTYTNTLCSAQRKEPAAVAQSIISTIPGASAAAKTSTALVAGSIAAYLISKEIYILDGEIFEMACMFGAYAIWYVNGKNAAADYLNDRKSVSSLSGQVFLFCSND